jgi:hypothetical protein
MVSLFEYISSAAVNGGLPEDFSLPSLTYDENELKWADGALDGVTMYHMAIPEISKEDRVLISDAVRAASNRDYDLADSLFKMLGKHLQAIVVIDDLQSYIMDNQSKLDAKNLSEYAIHLLLESSDRECVKFGLSLLELFDTDDKKNLKDAVRTIGLSDEFALFAIFVMRKWKAGNNDIWELAKKLHGWGRIHAVEHLEPETDEIRSWILTEGIHNDVMAGYLALTCWEKSNAEDILRNGPSREEFTAIGEIIYGLLDEGPAPGISRIPDSEEILFAYLDVAATMELTLDDYEVIDEIFGYAEEEYSEKSPLALECKRLLHTYHAWCLMLDAVKQGRCFELAIDSGINIKPYAFDLMDSSFEKNCHLCRYLMQDPEYRDKTVEIFRRELPLEEMKTQPTKTLGLGYEYRRQRALEFLLQELRTNCFEGQDFVETGLQSAPVRTRNCSLTVIECWVQAEQKPLSALMPDMWELLSELSEIEPDDNVRTRMKRLLDGAVEFGPGGFAPGGFDPDE